MAPQPALSSLPPSSPPSTSSKPANVDDSRYEELMDEYDPDASTASDPFGFFAVERKLKVLREQYRPADDNYNTDDASIEDLYTDSHPETDASIIIFPTPQPRRLETALERTDTSTANPLLTPHKRKRKDSQLKRTLTTSPSHSSTVPSTPSPSKRKVRERALDDGVKRTTGLTLGHDYNVDVDKENDPVVDSKAGKRTRRVAKKARPSMLDPKELAKGLESLLPKRPRRVGTDVAGRVGKPRKAKGKPRAVDSSDGEGLPNKGKSVAKRAVGKNKQPVEKKVVARKATGKGKTAGKVKDEGKVKEEREEDEFDVGGDEQNKWALERQTRLDYFRKLDHYVVEKENVYVV